jgi:glutathione reductase (NADPH)
MDAVDFDLITIGAGSGGVAASRRAAMHGARVAIVEDSRVGGTCVIRGCVPKKLMMYAAQYGEAAREAAGYGWVAAEPARFEMPRWAAAKAGETARLEKIYRDLLAGSGVTLVEGRARIVAPNVVEVGERRLRAKHLLIAAGSSPIRDSIPGVESCATSDELLDLQSLPERAGVIGGGYIAVEFASILARLGVKVSIFYRDRLPLRGFDEDLRQRAAAAMQTAGIEINPRCAPVRVARSGAVFLLVARDERVREFPYVLNATGRRPNTRDLGLETLGIEVDEWGAVPVDDHLRTRAPDVYAIGDVTNRKNLTPVAIAEGRAVADALFAGQGQRVVDLDRVASAVFMLPPIGSIGPGESELVERGRAVRVFEADFRPMRQTFFGGQERSYMKLLVDAGDDRVLAVHMLGADAPEIVQSLAVALSAGATKADFDRTMAVHPTAAEEFVLMREPSRVVGKA